MKTTFSAAGIVTVVLALSGAASAQTYVAPGLGIGGYGYGGYGYHASTFEEGVMRGNAAQTLAWGQANYYNSLAAINIEDARTRYIQNRQKATDAYFYLRQSNRAARDAASSQRLTRDEYVSLARKEAPAPLNQKQYERTLGRIEWPAVLATGEFSVEREALDRAFAARSPEDSGPTSDFYRNVHELTDSLQAKLKGKIGDLDAAQYVAAKRFVLSLAYESQRPMLAGSLAMAK